jgi:glutaredoxin 2
MNYKIVSLTSNDVSEMLTLSRQSIKEDFPEYSTKVAQIYAEKYFSEKHYKDLLKQTINHIFGVKDNNKLLAVIVLKENTAVYCLLIFLW